MVEINLSIIENGLKNKSSVNKMNVTRFKFSSLVNNIGEYSLLVKNITILLYYSKFDIT